MHGFFFIILQTAVIGIRSLTKNGGCKLFLHFIRIFEEKFDIIFQSSQLFRESYVIKGGTIGFKPEKTLIEKACPVKLSVSGIICGKHTYGLNPFLWND